MSDSDIRSIVISALVSTNPELGESSHQIEDDTLIGTGGLEMSSLALIHAFVAIEKQLGMVFDDRDVATARFDTVGGLLAFVRRAAGGVVDVGERIA